MGGRPEALTESMYYVLLSLRGEDRCGTEMATWARDVSAGRVTIGPGTLYTILAGFEDGGLIRQTAAEGRKRTYTITEAGAARLETEHARLRLCLEDWERSERDERVESDSLSRLGDGLPGALA